MSTNASFAPIAFPELGLPAQPPRGQRRPAPVVAPSAADDDMRTRPVAVRMTPLAFPALVKDETNETRERAHVQGHAAGYAAGRRAATETLSADRAALRTEHDRVLSREIEGVQSALSAVQQAAAELNAHTTMALGATEDQVLAAAIEIAGVILGRAIAEDPTGSAVAALKRAIEAAPPVPVRVVRMHPADVDVVAALAAADHGTQLVPDARVQRGDAYVDLPDGVVDACIGSAIERVRRALAGDDE